MIGFCGFRWCILRTTCNGIQVESLNLLRLIAILAHLSGLNILWVIGVTDGRLFVVLGSRAVSLAELGFDLLILLYRKLIRAGLKDELSLLAGLGLGIEFRNQVAVTLEQTRGYGTELSIAL